MFLVGALVASNGTLLGDDLAGWLIEVRVEQSLSEPTRFALRFQEDICEGNPVVSSRKELERGNLITVVTRGRAGGAATCLVHGPITQIKCNYTLGGPGSWIEVLGQDRRVEMSRVCERRRWTGLASAAVTSVLRDRGFTPDVEETSRDHSEESGTLNQRATDLEFVTRMARQNNQSFWITCEAVVTGRSVRVSETAHVKSSPARRSAAGPVALSPTSPLELRVHTQDECGHTVTQFSVSENAENPSLVRATALNDRDGGEDRVEVTDPQPAVEPNGRRRDAAPADRVICLTTPGDAQELQPRAEAAMTDAGWFVDATANTTAHLLNGVLQPHEIVSVTGAGQENSGAYQVKAVTHVLQALEHYMDLTLRRNATGGS